MESEGEELVVAGCEGGGVLGGHFGLCCVLVGLAFLLEGWEVDVVGVGVDVEGFAMLG